MSENTNPVSAVFAFQRNSIEQSHKALQRGVEFQQDLNGVVVDSFQPMKDAQKRSNDAVRAGFDSYFDAIESAVPGDQAVVADIRATVDEQLDTLEDSQLDAFEALEENLQDGSDSVAELLEDFLETLDEQVEALLEAHEDLEDQTVEALETLDEQVTDLQDELEAQGEEFQEQVEGQLEELTEQLEAQADTVQSQIEDMTEQVEDVANQAA